MTTLHRASVTAHWPTWTTTHTIAAPTTIVVIAFPTLDKRFGRSQAIGPTTVIGGGSVSPVTEWLIARAPGRAGCRGS